jgi:hypothetical protein
MSTTNHPTLTGMPPSIVDSTIYAPNNPIDYPTISANSFLDTNTPLDFEWLNRIVIGLEEVILDMIHKNGPNKIINELTKIHAEVQSKASLGAQSYTSKWTFYDMDSDTKGLVRMKREDLLSSECSRFLDRTRKEEYVYVDPKTWTIISTKSKNGKQSSMFDSFMKKLLKQTMPPQVPTYPTVYIAPATKTYGTTTITTEPIWTPGIK